MMIVIAILVLVAAYPFAVEARRAPMNAVVRQSAPGAMVELSQGVTHVEWHGPVRGPVAVCVHGLTTPSFVWQGLVSGLAAMGYRLLTYDLYGRGFSDRPRGKQDQGFFLQQLEELLTSQDVDEDFTLIGYSMGGSIATCFAAKHPGRVRHLVLLAPAGMSMIANKTTNFIRKTPLLGDWLMLAGFPRKHHAAAEAERDVPSSVPNVSELQQRELAYRGFVPAVLASLRGILARSLEAEHRTIHRAGIPVLAIWARHDDIIPLAAMGKLTEWSRSAHQEVIEEAGHSLVYTHTDAVLSVLSERLREGLN